MGTVRIRAAAAMKKLADATFAAHRARILELLPRAEVEHVGATAVPGALTKGDLDLLVRVERIEFSAAVQALEGAYEVHQPGNWTASLASFKDAAAAEPPVGVQLVVGGSVDDALFAPFRDALIDDPRLLEEYNALKLELDGAEYERYTAEKGRFVERVLRETCARAT